MTTTKKKRKTLTLRECIFGEEKEMKNLLPAKRPYKTCLRCREKKRSDKFHKDGRGGYRSTCADCERTSKLNRETRGLREPEKKKERSYAIEKQEIHTVKGNLFDRLLVDMQGFYTISVQKDRKVIITSHSTKKKKKMTIDDLIV